MIINEILIEKHTYISHIKQEEIENIKTSETKYEGIV